MGQHAEDLINGDVDFFTGEYIGGGHGYPQTADKSLPWEKRDGKLQNLQSKKKLTNADKQVLTQHGYTGVTQYLSRKFPALKAVEVIQRYGTTVLGMEPSASAQDICYKITFDFAKFRRWLSENQKE